MRNIFVISAFLCILSLSALAQNLDPTVEVSREYQGQLVEVHKPVFEMAVPDSVTRFALDFDYSVFENPYKGSYEFNPYLLSMKPSASDNGESRFYLRAGAGYQPYPTLDMVWSPKFKHKGFNMDVYALHRSFFGNYLTIMPESREDGGVVLARMKKDEDGKDKWYGYDMLSKAGVIFRHDWEKVALDYSAAYYGLAQKEPQWKRGYNAVDGSLGIHTKPASRESLMFGLDVDYRFGQDVVGGSMLSENLGALALEIGPFMMGSHRVSLDLVTNIASYRGAFEMMSGDVSFTPRYVFRNDRFTADLGLCFSKMMTKDDLNEQYVYPDVDISYVLIPNSMKLYFRANGGGTFETYSSTIESNHHVTHLMSSDILGYEIQRVGLTAGFDGRITDKFSYNIRGGYANYASLRNYSVSWTPVPSFSMAYMSCEKWFAALDWALDVEGLRFDGSVSYDNYWDRDGQYENGSEINGYTVLKPAALTGDFSLEYNWRRRLVFGADCEFSGAMKGYFVRYQPDTDCVPILDVIIPGYADLGVYAEYATARNISFWMRAGNLLNMTIQRTPLYAEKGVNFTIGICMNL